MKNKNTVTLLVGISAVGAALWYNKQHQQQAIASTGDNTAMVVGTVSSGRGGSALLMGVRVEISGRSSLTDFNGKFSIPDVEAGDNKVILLSVEGYDTFALTANIVPGINDLGLIELLPMELEPELADLTGTVVDGDTGEAVVGATVTAQDKIAVTDGGGSFTLYGLQATSSELLISVGGFPDYAVDVTLLVGENTIGVVSVFK
jgi:hypothetical protein